jgi:hypothetical protein
MDVSGILSPAPQLSPPSSSSLTLSFFASSPATPGPLPLVSDRDINSTPATHKRSRVSVPVVRFTIRSFSVPSSRCRVNPAPPAPATSHLTPLSEVACTKCKKPFGAERALAFDGRVVKVATLALLSERGLSDEERGRACCSLCLATEALSVLGLGGRYHIAAPAATSVEAAAASARATRLSTRGSVAHRSIASSSSSSSPSSSSSCSSSSSLKIFCISASSMEEVASTDIDIPSPSSAFSSALVTAVDRERDCLPFLILPDERRLSHDGAVTLANALFPSQFRAKYLLTVPGGRLGIAGRCFGAFVTYENLQSLFDNQTVNGSVLDFIFRYLNYIARIARAADVSAFEEASAASPEASDIVIPVLDGPVICGKGALRPSRLFWAASTDFYSKLTGGASNAYNYSNVQSWLKAAGIDIRLMELVLVPVHHFHSEHWTLGAIEIGSRTLHYFESHTAPRDSICVDIDLDNSSLDLSTLGRFGLVCLNLVRWARDASLDAAQSNGLLHGPSDPSFGHASTSSSSSSSSGISSSSASADFRLWKVIVHSASEVPQQCDPISGVYNGVDCGIFCAEMARCLAEGMPWNFSQRDVAYLRRKYALLILRAGAGGRGLEGCF